MPRYGCMPFGVIPIPPCKPQLHFERFGSVVIVIYRVG